MPERGQRQPREPAHQHPYQKKKNPLRDGRWVPQVEKKEAQQAKR